MSSFGLIHWLIFGLIAWVLFSAVRNFSSRKSGEPMVCKQCEHQGTPRIQTRGHFALELVLWPLFIVPGVVYSIWRLASRRPVCDKCGSPDLVPPDTPAGRRIAASNRPPA